MSSNPKLRQAILETLGKHGMIAGDKYANYQSHAVGTEILEYKVHETTSRTSIQVCKVCTKSGADLYDEPCTGLPPITDCDELGIF